MRALDLGQRGVRLAMEAEQLGAAQVELRAPGIPLDLSRERGDLLVEAVVDGVTAGAREAATAQRSIPIAPALCMEPQLRLTFR